MLSDHRFEVERRAARMKYRQQLPLAFGNFIAGLADWDWFINPITFRDIQCQLEPRDGPGQHRYGHHTICDPDPRLKIWQSTWRRQSWRWAPLFGPPAPVLALTQIKEFLGELETAAGRAIGWVIGEEFGTIGGRYHCHVLIAAVGHLRRDEWWEKAYQRFGHTRIEPFDPQRAAAYYTAKYAAKQLGGLHFGGTLAGVDLRAIEDRTPQRGGGIDVMQSHSLPRGRPPLGFTMPASASAAT